jgi:hypothetical protein
MYLGVPGYADLLEASRLMYPAAASLQQDMVPARDTLWAMPSLPKSCMIDLIRIALIMLRCFWRNKRFCALIVCDVVAE